MRRMFFVLAFILSFLSYPLPVFAQLCNPNITPGGGDTGIDTAIGCIPVLAGTDTFIVWVFRWAVGIAGGIAFVLIVYAGIMITTSQGVPDRLRAGQELLFSAISGLLLLIFSVFVLQYIGVNILGIPLG